MSVFLIFAIALLFSLFLGLFRVRLGPTTSDCMLVAHLTSTTGVGLSVLLALALDIEALVDVSLALALLTAIASIAFVRLQPGMDLEDEP